MVLADTLGLGCATAQLEILMVAGFDSTPARSCAVDK